MTKINNLTLKKELKRNNKFLFMALIFLFLGLLLITYAIYQNFRKENYIYLAKCLVVLLESQALEVFSLFPPP